MSLAGPPKHETAAPAVFNDNSTELILVVEDDAALLNLIQKCLAASGHRTVGVSSGSAALAWLDRQSPRLMLLDYNLPDMHGKELLQRLSDQNKRVPFVVATGHGSETLAVEMMKHGAYDYVTKGPTFLKLLPVVIDRALERARQDERLARAEEQLREAHDELERRVERRTEELAEANRRLRVEMEERRRVEERSQRHLAELAHVARLNTAGEMVAELAHELNQPLSAISSYSQACKRLLESNGPECASELSAALNQVGEQANRAGEMIHHLRRFVAKAKPLQSVVDMNAMIRDVTELMSIDSRLAEAGVIFEFAEPLPPVVGDRIQLEQVLVNLMRNGFESLRESAHKPRRLTVRTTMKDPQNIMVAVLDNGGGIAPDMSERIFDRFVTTKSDGMGMGLAICQSIIENHGGELAFAPAPQGGAIFFFTLPIENGRD